MILLVDGINSVLFTRLGIDMKFQVADVFTKSEWEELTTQLNFSPQQIQVVHCLLEGMGDKQIAATMGISEHTVRTYLGRIFTKQEVQNRNELLVGIFRQFRDGCVPAECPRQC